jgi:mitofusin 2
LREFSQKEWIIRYPQLHHPSQDSGISDSPATHLRRHGLKRSLSFADDPTSEREVILTATKRGLTRSITLASIPDVQNEQSGETDEPDATDSPIDPSGFQLLRLDLKLGAHGSSSSCSSLVSQLEKSSIANLLGERITACINHIEKLRLRVEDTSSKVLVTGDLNAGKSTFVNALLRREIMPVDQQPCTTVFCEVHDAA